jgi:hypothetical protein
MQGDAAPCRLDEPPVALDRLAIPRLRVGPGVLLRLLEPRPLPEQVAVVGETPVEWAYPRMAARAERLLASGVGRRRSRAEFTGAVIGRGSAAPSLPPISAPTREAALDSSASSHRSEPGRGRDARGGSAPRPRAGPSREARLSPTGWVRWAARCPRAPAARAGSGLRRSRGRAVSLTPVGGGSRRASGRRVEKCFVAGCALTLQRSRPSSARHQAARAPAANVEATARLQAPTQRILADVKRRHVVSGACGSRRPARAPGRLMALLAPRAGGLNELSGRALARLLAPDFASRFARSL